MAQRRGRYPSPPGSPATIPGLELAGEVIAAGRQVTRFEVGDRVMALTGGGGQAELAVIDETHAMAVPAGVPWAAAGGFPETFCTAHDALFTQCSLASGERLLVTGAGGGVGTAAVQLGALTGATVIGSVRRPEHRDRVSGLGASVAVDPAEVPEHGPYDVVLELIGAASFPGALSSLAIEGRMVVIGVGSGAQVELNLGALMGKRARLGGSTLRVRDRVAKALVVERVRRHVLPHLEAGRLSVPVETTFPFSEAQAAYDAFEAGGKFGKIVLVAP
jgi:NADPH:quinone reductase-like Zn-dependent oxidoreductase